MGAAGAPVLQSGMRNGVVTAKAGSAFTEDFLTYFFKVTPCNRKYPHDWASCVCGHKGERANRRDLNTHKYLPIACQYAKQKLDCPRGDACPNSHNLFEYWLHPQRYKTEMCLFRANCDRQVCFFAHSAEELRALDPNLPPAEVCWSAGAALAGKDGSTPSSRDSRSSRSAAAAANRQQRQQKLQMQQLQQQAMLAPVQDISTIQQQLVAGGVNVVQQQQQPVLVQMASGELAMLAPMQQQQQQQHVLLDASVQNLAVGLHQQPMQAGNSMLGSMQPLQQLQFSPIGGTYTPQGTFVPAGATATAVSVAPMSSATWPQQQLVLEPLQQQQQQYCIYASSSLGTTQQQLGISTYNSSACTAPGLICQQGGSFPSMNSTSPATPNLLAGSMFGCGQTTLQTAANNSPLAALPVTAALGPCQPLQTQAESLLTASGCSSATGSGSYGGQLAAVISTPAAGATVPISSLYTHHGMGAGYSQGLTLPSQGFTSQGLMSVTVSAAAGGAGDMNGLLTALQGMQIQTAVTTV